MSGRDSSVGIATTLRAGRPGDRIPVGARFSAPVQIGPGAHPASYTMGTGSSPGVKWPGRGADLHPHLQCRGLKQGKAIPLPTLRVLVAYTGRTFTLTFRDRLCLVLSDRRTRIIMLSCCTLKGTNVFLYLGKLSEML